MGLISGEAVVKVEVPDCGQAPSWVRLVTWFYSWSKRQQEGEEAPTNSLEFWRDFQLAPRLS